MGLIGQAAPRCRFPLELILQRLLQLAAGTWPTAASGTGGSLAAGATAAGVIEATLASALRDDRAPLLQLMQSLLCGGAAIVASGTSRAVSLSLIHI